MREQDLLRVENLGITFTRSGYRATNNVNISVSSGECVGIVGESGSGKSTTALSILRLLEEETTRYDPGSAVRYRGKNLLELPPSELTKIRGAQISMVFQDPLASLNPVLRAGHQIRDVVARHTGKSRAECRFLALRALEDAGIPMPERVYRSYPYELSGGLRQRVMIAMAIACGPELLVADEPTSALDATVQADVLRTFSRLVEQLNMSLLLISHDIGVVSHMCERIYVLYEGEVVENGPTAQIIDNPIHSYTKSLVSSARHRVRV